MPPIEFSDLVGLYRNTTFGPGGDEDESRLKVASQGIVDLLTRLESDGQAARDANIILLDDLKDVTIGAEVKVRVLAPRTGLGILARTLDELLASPSAKLSEPRHLYLAKPAYASGDQKIPDPIARYRKVLAVIDLFAQAASFLDATRGELVFVKDSRVVVPVKYVAADVTGFDVDGADRLLEQFNDDLHKDQKLEILFEALVELCRGPSQSTRMSVALHAVDDLATAVRSGYKLFASSFSYNKIRSEIEDARIDYTQKIHKTIVDIQSQLLGIPVATVVVASQMKAPTTCGAELLVNSAILIGAWIFLVLLIIAIVNQWLTLGVIKAEIERQRSKMTADFPTVSDDFAGTFDALKGRIWWHRAGLVVVAIIGVGGAVAGTCFHDRIAGMTPQPCAASNKTGATPTPAVTNGPQKIFTPTKTVVEVPEALSGNSSATP